MQHDDPFDAAPRPEEDQDDASNDNAPYMPESGDRLGRLMELLGKVKASGGMNLLAMDGYLHGVLCLPGMVPPSLFLPPIFGEDDEPMLLSEEELKEAMELVLWWYGDLSDGVDGGDFQSEPWLWFALGDRLSGEPEESLEDEEQPDAAVQRAASDETEIEKAAEWAKGFLQALDLGGALDRLLGEEKTVQLLPMLMLLKNQLPVEEDSPDYGKPLDPETFDLALTILPKAISGIYKFLRTPVKKKARIARNDPCPCGSGKKYKKCCLNG